MKAKVITSIEVQDFESKLNAALEPMDEEKILDISTSTTFDANRGSIRYTATVIFIEKKKSNLHFGSLG